MADNNTNKESIFRTKSIQRIESPEKLNDYLKVTSPGVWLILGTVIVLLVGVCIWGIFGEIDATVPAAVVSTGNSSECLVPAAALEGVIDHRTVKVDNWTLTLTPSILEPEIVGTDTDVYVMLAGNLQAGDIIYRIPLEQPLPKGTYTGTLVTETMSPVSLFF